MSAGYNHLDVKMIKSRNVRVANTPGVQNDATAEQGITLMLAAARNTVIGIGRNFRLSFSQKIIILFKNRNFDETSKLFFRIIFIQ